MAEQNSYQVVMPKLGLTMIEASIVEWKVDHGGWVNKGDDLFSLESDKSLLDIEAPASGTVEILVPSGQKVPVHTPIAFIHKEGMVNQSQTVHEDTSKTVEPVTGKNLVTGRVEPKQSAVVRATPRARKIARQNGISLENISGSGPRAMIVGADLSQYLSANIEPTRVKATPLARRIASREGISLEAVSAAAAGGVIRRSDVERVLSEIKSPSLEKDYVNELPLSGLRKVIAERLVAGWRERPQVTLVSEIDATNLVSARQQVIDETGYKVSFNAWVIKAVAKALVDLPYMNVQLLETGCTQMKDINIGIAIDTDRGLVVPVIRQANQKNLLQIQKEISESGQAAFEGRIKPDQMTGGTFTITNLGAFGVDAFTPIINPPETAILGVGKIAPRAVVESGHVVAKDTVTLSLSFDHRLIDGAPAARFLQRIELLLQRPCVLSGDLNTG